jgi:hypothetical protein
MWDIAFGTFANPKRVDGVQAGLLQRRIDAHPRHAADA